MNTNTTSGAADLPEARLFTKKPVTIAAIQWFKNGDHPQVRAIAPSDDLFFTGVGGATLTDREKYGVIGTLESPNHLVTPGDWIITGVAGEHYACKPDIFEATYSPAALAAGWKACANFCNRDDVVADGIIGFGACPQVEAAFSAAQPVAREPLTNAQREKIIEAVDWYNFPQDVIDAVERAHGIKGGQHGTESST